MKEDREKIGIITMNITPENSGTYSTECSLNCHPFSIVEERWGERSEGGNIYLEVVVELPKGDFSSYQEQCLNGNDMVRGYEVVEEY
jgi:hypothetical protein